MAAQGLPGPRALAEVPPPPEPAADWAGFRTQASSRAGISLGGRYRIVGLLARGGSSDVYLAEDTQTGGAVIVKWLRPDSATDAEMCARFVLGAHATMAIHHPAIARVLGVEQPATDPPYLVMEALVGEPLADYLDREGPMPQELVVTLAREVAAGLAAAHRTGILHRDIKPGNLYLCGPIGAPRGIKVIDFGLARDVRQRRAGGSSDHVVLGTVQYMAPEQLLADPVDARTDVYALGVVLFRMLTGQLPFDLDPGADLFGHQLFSPAPPPSWLVENVDSRMEQVVLRCMRKHPRNRYPSMEALLEDLDVIAGVRPAENGQSVRSPLARHPDVYKPRNHQGRDVAELLALHFGTEPPPPPSSRLGAELPGASAAPEPPEVSGLDRD
jgi:serine/threonine-protein kinase